jgi:hypothetical protein
MKMNYEMNHEKYAAAQRAIGAIESLPRGKGDPDVDLDTGDTRAGMPQYRDFLHIADRDVLGISHLDDQVAFSVYRKFTTSAELRALAEWSAELYEEVERLRSVVNRMPADPKPKLPVEAVIGFTLDWLEENRSLPYQDGDAVQAIARYIESATATKIRETSGAPKETVSTSPSPLNDDPCGYDPAKSGPVWHVMAMEDIKRGQVVEIDLRGAIVIPADLSASMMGKYRRVATRDFNKYEALLFCPTASTKDLSGKSVLAISEWSDEK